jgi:uncharacterized protein YeaO (DUF488 family)
VFEQLHLEILDRLALVGRLDWSRAGLDSMTVRAKQGGHVPLCRLRSSKEFDRRYREELNDAERAPALEHLREVARSGTLTLLTATRHAEISQAAVLADLIRG